MMVKKTSGDYWREHRQKLKTLGLCIDCKDSTLSTHFRCIKCKQKYSLRLSNKYKDRISTGFCGQCGLKSETFGKSCNRCKESARLKYKNNPEPIIKQIRYRTYENKKLLFSKYGSQCIQCGESRLGCLELDHINGGGSDHRESVKVHRSGGGAKFYLALLKQGIFPDTLQILCANCHALKHCKYMELAITNGS